MVSYLFMVKTRKKTMFIAAVLPTQSMASLISGWAWLPKNLLDSILDCMIQFSDYVRFCSVCKPWRLAARDDSPQHLIHKQKFHILKTCHNQLPLLMTPTKENSENKRNLYNVTEGVTCDLQVRVPYNKRCFGSSHGWLFTIEESMAITLISPFADKTIRLPEFKHPSNYYECWVDTRDYFICKGILSSDPCLNPDDYEVMMIYQGMRKLAWFKSGDEAWTFKDLKEEYVFTDVTYYKGRFYAVNDARGLVCVDIATGTETVIIERGKILCVATITYLVESHGGDLLMVQRYDDRDFVDNMGPDGEDDDMGLYFKTSKFEVYKFHSNGQAQPAWVQIERLGYEALFLGDNYSVSVRTSEFPGCLPNCIYYTDHYFDIGSYVPRGVEDDTGVFNLEDRSFGSHYIPDPSHPKHLLPLIWIVPNLKNT